MIQIQHVYSKMTKKQTRLHLLQIVYADFQLIYRPQLSIISILPMWLIPVHEVLSTCIMERYPAYDSELVSLWDGLTCLSTVTYPLLTRRTALSSYSESSDVTVDLPKCPQLIWISANHNIIWFLHLQFIIKSRGSSVSIVSDYGLDDQSSIPDRGRGFFL
jgi:hypothetical protein